MVRGSLAVLVFGALVLVTGCGGSNQANPKPVPGDPRLQRAGLNANTGGTPDAVEKPKASVNISPN
jgi:hypothetical protein